MQYTSLEIILLCAVAALLAVLTIVIVVLTRRNRLVRKECQSLAAQAAEALHYKELYQQLAAKKTKAKANAKANANAMNDEQLFQYLHDIIVREQLFLNPRFGRQTIMTRFQLTKERVGAAFSKGSQYTQLKDYIQHLRLDYAAQMLKERPEMSVVQIAKECGFSSHKYFSDRFRRYFGVTPSDYRLAK